MARRIGAIYVQGCARSGNTLMRELCVAAFRDAQLIKLTENRSECGIDKVIEQIATSTERMWVASRNRTSSLFMDREQVRRHPMIGIIWMLRNPLDVLTSTHKEKKGFYVEPYRFIASLNLYLQFASEPQVLAVKYEDLVNDPSSVQRAITDKFGIEVIRDFMLCHEHFPRFRQNVEALHSIRPIDTKSLEKWRSNAEYREYLVKVLKTHPELVEMARCCGGYEISLSELEEGEIEKGGALKRVLASFGSKTSDRTNQ